MKITDDHLGSWIKCLGHLTGMNANCIRLHSHNDFFLFE